MFHQLILFQSAIPVGQEGDLVSGHFGGKTSSTVDTLQMVSIPERRAPSIETEVLNEGKGEQSKVTHVLSLELSRSSFDSIISERPGFTPEELGLTEHLSCVCSDRYTMKNTLIRDDHRSESPGTPHGESKLGRARLHGVSYRW